MNVFLMKAGMGAALAATALAAAAPADAQRWRGGYRHHGGGDAAGAAIVGGILGLGIGAAIASNNNRDRYYDRGGYYDRDGYYDRGYYDRGYYAQPYYDDYRPRCWRQWRWDPYYGQQVPVRVCR